MILQIGVSWFVPQKVNSGHNLCKISWFQSPPTFADVSADSLKHIHLAIPIQGAPFKLL